jgi:murein DD-endopeptidase MepM/ murein hydrolase activator NlpD
VPTRRPSSARRTSIRADAGLLLTGGSLVIRMLARRSLSVALAAAALTTVAAQPAAASTPIFQVPFECGERVYGQTNHGRGADGVRGTKDDHYYSVDFNQNEPRYDADDGMTVVASAAGITIEVDTKAHGDAGDYGTVVIDHGGGWRTLYAHMRSRVPVGTWVQAGDPIGRVSDVSPRNVPSHLHYQQLHGEQTVPARFDDEPYGYFPRPGKYLTSRNCADDDGSTSRRSALADEEVSAKRPQAGQPH